MASDVAPLRLSIPSDLRFIPIVQDFVASVCQVGRLETGAMNAVILATNEAVSNVIRHAHRDRPSALVQIECRVQDGGIEVCLLDEGEPFDLAAVPVLDPKEVRPGGRGVFIMRSCMDELNCRPRAERGNTLRMVKRCSGVSAAGAPPSGA